MTDSVSVSTGRSMRSTLSTLTLAAALLLAYLLPLSALTFIIDPNRVGSAVRGGASVAWSGLWFVATLIFLGWQRKALARILGVLAGLTLASQIGGAAMEIQLGHLAVPGSVPPLISVPLQGATLELFAWTPVAAIVFVIGLALLAATVLISARTRQPAASG